MKVKPLFWLAALGSLSLLLPSLARSQDPGYQNAIGLVSYNDLLSRMSQLETRFQGQNTEFQQASYAIGGGAVHPDGCGSCGGGNCGGGCAGGWYGLYEHVIVQPHLSSDTAFFVVNDGTVPSFRQVSFDWDVQYSPRFELGYLDHCGGMGWRARYWHFDGESTAQERIVGDDRIVAGWGDDGVDIGLGTSDGDGVISALATHSIEIDVLDLEVQFRECNWTYSGGIRFAQMDQTYSATGDDEGDIDIFTLFHDFKGWGPTVAAEFHAPWRCGVTLFAKARASLLFGETRFTALSLMNGAANNTGDRIDHVSDNDLLAVGEMQLGVDWRTCVLSGRVLFVTAALEAQYWSSAGTGHPLLTDPLDEGNYQSEDVQSADLGFYGVTIGTGLLY